MLSLSILLFSITCSNPTKDNNTSLGPRATRNIKVVANLKSDPGPRFGHVFGQADTWAVKDLGGNEVRITIDYENTGLDTWKWTAIDSNGGTFNEKTGILVIGNYGDIIFSQTGAGFPFYTVTPTGGYAVTIRLPSVGINIFEVPRSFAYSVSAGGTGDTQLATYQRDFHDFSTLVYDRLGSAYDFKIRLEKNIDIEGLATWLWAVTQAVPSDSKAEPWFQGNGYIQFTDGGKYDNLSIIKPILIKPSDMILFALQE